MKKWHEYRWLQDQIGATVITVVLVLTFLIGVVAFALNIGYRHVTRNELQNIADGAALAAARQLGVLYQGMTYEEQQVYNPNNNGDAVLIRNVAQDVGLSNEAASKSIVIVAADILIGRWSPSQPPEIRFTTPDPLLRPNAVRVTARRETGFGNNDPISTFFSWAIGVEEIGVRATAIAALTGQSTSEPGELELPIGISKAWFDTNPGEVCGDQIKFSPTVDPDACGGWTSWDYGANDVTLRRILDGEEDYLSPGTVAGDSIFNFIGGDLSTVTFDALLSLFQRQGSDVDLMGDWIYDGLGNQIQFASEAEGGVPLYESDGVTPLLYPDGSERNKHAWETGVVVYAPTDGSEPNCDNVNQSQKIVGFARVKLTDVLGPPDKLILGFIECDSFDQADSRGGGGEAFGLMGSIPGLVL
ncbi:pilus assembly protein TadG-related protein [Thermodesulfobacteriota bacterium]